MAATLISYEKAWSEIERMEAECGCPLADIPDGDSLRGRALRLLESDDPPRGDDQAFCLRVLSGNLIAG